MELNGKKFSEYILYGKKCELEGVFTVEAALVIPVVIGCLLFVILMAFSLHDYAVLKAAAAETVTGGFSHADAPGRDSLLYYRNCAWEKEHEETGAFIWKEHRYRVRYQAEETDLIARLTGSLIGGYDPENIFSVQGTAEYIRCNPEKLIWLCQIFTEQSKGDGGNNGGQIPLGTE